MGKITETVKQLIIINVIFFIGSQLVGDQAFQSLSIWFPKNEHFRIWQVFTHMFMHSKTFIFHILMNMFGLYMFGSPLEQMWGRNKFLFFYFSAGLGAVLLPWAIDYYQFNTVIHELVNSGYNKIDILGVLNKGNYNPEWVKIVGNETWLKFIRIFSTSSLGASGCVMGLVVAFGVSFPNAKLALIFLPIPVKAKYFIPIIVAYEIYSGFSGGNSMFGVNVAHFAHVGGALVGFLIAWYWKQNQFKRWN